MGVPTRLARVAPGCGNALVSGLIRLLLVLAFCASGLVLVHAQARTGNAVNAVPDAPAEGGRSALSGTFTAESSRQFFPTVRDFAIDSYTRPKTVDRQFVLLNSFVFLATAADAETSLHAVHLGLREVNPIFGSHPTRTEYYSVGTGLDLLTVYLSYHYKRISPSRTLWKAFPLSTIAVHSFDTVFNLASAYGR